MNGRVIKTLIAKDLTLFFRNRFFALISGLGIVGYLAIYFLLPREIDDQLMIGVYEPSTDGPFAELMGAENLVVTMKNSEEALKEGILDGEFNAGVALPADFVASLSEGREARLKLYFGVDFPEELKSSFEIIFKELVFVLAGRRIDIESTEEILGVDRSGAPIAYRDRMRPLFAVVILLIETMDLATLIAEEREARTLHALLVTPVAMADLFAAKAVTGIGLAFSQAALLMALIGGLALQPTLILATLALGAVFVTGVGFLLASAARDMMSVVAWGVLAIVILSLPSVGVLFPGLFTGWVKLIPSYYLVDAVHRAANFGAGWNELWPNLVGLGVFGVAAMTLGSVVLGRRLS